MKYLLMILMFCGSYAMSQDRTKEAIQLSKMFDKLYLDNKIDSALMLASSYMGGHDTKVPAWSQKDQKRMLVDQVEDIGGSYDLELIKSFYYPKYWSYKNRLLEAYVIYWKVNDEYFIINNIVNKGDKLFVDHINIWKTIEDGPYDTGANNLSILLKKEEYKFNEIEKYIKKNG